MIENAQQLRAAVNEAGGLIQEISDYLAQHPEHQRIARLRFPRGYIRTAYYTRQRLEFVQNEVLRRNVSYAIMTHDVLRWLAFRTDIAGQAKEMLIKEAVCLIGTVCESISIFPGEQGLGRNAGFRNRVRRLRDLNVLDDPAVELLEWLWDKRNQEHLYDLPFREWGHYVEADWLRSVEAYQTLTGALREWRRNRQQRH